MLSYYGLDDRQILAMPLRRFLLLNKNVDRLRAETDIRSLQLLCAAQSGEQMKRQFDDLIAQMGKVAVTDAAKDDPFAGERLDSEGLMYLKELGRLK